MDTIQKYIGTEFLGEPIYRWFAFLVVLMFAFVVWNGIIGYMKGA